MEDTQEKQRALREEFDAKYTQALADLKKEEQKESAQKIASDHIRSTLISIEKDCANIALRDKLLDISSKYLLVRSYCWRVEKNINLFLFIMLTIAGVLLTIIAHLPLLVVCIICIIGGIIINFLKKLLPYRRRLALEMQNLEKDFAEIETRTELIIEKHVWFLYNNKEFIASLQHIMHYAGGNTWKDYVPQLSFTFDCPLNTFKPFELTNFPKIKIGTSFLVQKAPNQFEWDEYLYFWWAEGQLNWVFNNY